MARINGVEPRDAGWFTRLVDWLARWNLRNLTDEDRLVEPLKVTAHHPRLLFAMGEGRNAKRMEAAA